MSCLCLSSAGPEGLGQQHLDNQPTAPRVWVHGQRSRGGDHLALWGQMLQLGQAMGTLVPGASSLLAGRLLLPGVEKRAVLPPF